MTERKAWHVDQVQVMSAFKRFTLMCSGGIQRLKAKRPQEQVAGQKETVAACWLSGSSL